MIRAHSKVAIPYTYVHKVINNYFCKKYQKYVVMPTGLTTSGKKLKIGKQLLNLVIRKELELKIVKIQ